MIVVAASVMDSKVIDNKAEDYRASFIFEEDGCVIQLVIAVLGELRGKLIISKLAGSWEPVYAFTYFYIDMEIMYEVGEVVGSKDGRWN